MIASRNVHLSLLAALVLSVGWQVGVRAQETVAVGPSALKGLPVETSLLIKLRNGADSLRKLKESPLHKLKDDPGFKKFLESLETRISEDSAELRQKLGFAPLDVLLELKGEVVVAVGSLDKLISAVLADALSGGATPVPEIASGDLPILIVADAGSATGKVRDYFAKISEFLVAEGGRKEEREFRGGKITTFTNKNAGTAGAEGELEKIHFGELGSKFLFAGNQPFLEKTMVGLSGGETPSVGSDADFVATNHEVGLDSDLLVYLNIQSLKTSFAKSVQANPIYAGFWNLIETRLVGKNLKNIGYSCTLRGDGLHSVGFANTGGSREGLLGLLDGPTFSAAEAARNVPPNAETMNATTLHFPKLYQLLREVANTALGILQGTPGIDVEQMLELQFQIKVREIVDSLGTRLYYYTNPIEKATESTPTSPTSPTSPSPTSADAALDGALGDTIIGIELKSEQVIREFLGKLPTLLAQNFGLSPDDIKGEKYLERDVYNIVDAVTLAIVDNHIILGQEESVKDLIRRRSAENAPSLRDVPEYKAETARIPDRVTEFNFLRKSYVVENLEIIRELFATATEVDVPDLKPLTDMIGSGVGYSVWKDKGLYYSSWVLYEKSAAGK